MLLLRVNSYEFPQPTRKAQEHSPDFCCMLPKRGADDSGKDVHLMTMLTCQESRPRNYRVRKTSPARIVESSLILKGLLFYAVPVHK